VPSLSSRMMPSILTALGYRRRFASAQATAELVEARRLRPRPYGPPRLLPRGVGVSVDQDRGWPLYEVVGYGAVAHRRIVYIHGGAWINQISLPHWQLVAELAAATGSRVLVPIYPLAPQGTAATVVPQVADLLKRLAAKYGAENVSVVGDSAGGQIALAAALLLRDAHVVLAHTVLISPALDLSLGNPSIDSVEPNDKRPVRPGLLAAADLWRDGLALDDPIASPLFGEMAGLGPLAVFAGTRDITHPDCELLVSKARTAGVPTVFHEAPGMVHGFPLLPIPEGRQARRIMARLLRGGQDILAAPGSVPPAD
jgi:acetyl esterase/lipase